MATDLTSSMDVWRQASDGGSFEEAMSALESIVALLDGGELTLDESLTCFELGAKLSNRCQRLLEQAELRVEIVQQSLEVESRYEPPF